MPSSARVLVLGDDRLLEVLAADEARERQVVDLLLLGVVECPYICSSNAIQSNPIINPIQSNQRLRSCLWIEGVHTDSSALLFFPLLVDLPAGLVVATIVQELARISITTVASLLVVLADIGLVVEATADAHVARNLLRSEPTDALARRRVDHERASGAHVVAASWFLSCHQCSDQ